MSSIWNDKRKHLICPDAFFHDSKFLICPESFIYSNPECLIFEFFCHYSVKTRLQISAVKSTRYIISAISLCIRWSLFSSITLEIRNVEDKLTQMQCLLLQIHSLLFVVDTYMYLCVQVIHTFYYVQQISIMGVKVHCCAHLKTEWNQCLWCIKPRQDWNFLWWMIIPLIENFHCE